MTVTERLFSYIRTPVITSADLRWEAVLGDLRAGYVRLERVSGDRARIVVVGA